ncbi:hypothetical protein DPMN_090831 [Dreissena polymorpha]|uniref:Uncharacterized protein n=1 Tax=Dreissena polymorpha TaxID=45954 RepID=A0A9D4KYT8_DREPO|nr:hypothetical protein DPMN_090831 [Dreissena polymorpha]
MVFYQIKKCTSDECAYCVINPPRLPEDIFQSLHFVPDPVMRGGQYVVFDDIYGTETDDSARPGLQNVQPTSERDKEFKKILVASMSLYFSSF